MNRRKFMSNSLVAASGAAAAAGLDRPSIAFGSLAPEPAAARAGTGRGPLGAASFTFARLSYSSGNWDADPKMPANLLHSLAEYTPIRVDPNERIVDINSDELGDYPFLYLTGNGLVRFTEDERANLRRYLRRGGFMFVDDCEHNVEGTFAKTFEGEIRGVLDRPEEQLRVLPNEHPLYRAFFKFTEGPPPTSHELNGWGDRVVHNYLKAIEVNGRTSVLYSNKDYGCEWNYDWINKRFAAKDNTRFGVNIIVYALTH